MIEPARKAQVKFWIEKVRYRLQGSQRPIPRLDRQMIPSSWPMVFATREQYFHHIEARASEYEDHARLMRQLGAVGSRIVTSGYCIACRKPSRFRTDLATPGYDATLGPNWREGLICRGCGLNGRMRASVHYLMCAVEPEPGCRIYLTEQITALYRWVKLRFPAAVGSEYLRDGTRRGRTNRHGIRHEDLTALSFPDASFDAVISLEVMEHIPDFRKALSECVRVLRPGGKMLLSVPFHFGPEHTLRARIGLDGSMEHLLPPEFHGDPLDPQGCLCFHHFGWDLLDFMKAAGFREANALSIWSRALGFLGGCGDNVQFIAVK